MDERNMPIEPGGPAGDMCYPSAILHGTAKVWVQNELAGTKMFENVGIHCVLVILPSSGEVLLKVDPIRGRKVTISQASGSGHFDAATGLLDLHVVLNVASLFSATIDITISTEKTIAPPHDNSMSGQRRDPSGHISLVGDSSIVGPPGNTHGWFQIVGKLEGQAAT